MEERKITLHQFLDLPLTINGRSMFVRHGTLHMYVRSRPYRAIYWPYQLCLAGVEQRGRTGKGKFKKLLDELEPKYDLMLENVLNERLADMLIVKRNYRPWTQDPLSLIHTKR